MQNFEQNLLNTIEDKTETIKAIIKDYESTVLNIENMGKIIESINNNPDKINIAKLNKAYAQGLKSLFSISNKLLIIQIIYTGSDSFDTDCAHVLNKMGRGQDALRAMLKKKMRGL